MPGSDAARIAVSVMIDITALRARIDTARPGQALAMEPDTLARILDEIESYRAAMAREGLTFGRRQRL